jgi:excisionase family DNA binding protein
MNRLLTTQEAADLLRVNARTVLNWIDHDAIPYVALPQVGQSRRQYRIPLFGLLSSLEGTYDLAERVAELDAGVAAGTVVPPSEQVEAAEQADASATVAREAVAQLHAESA